MAQSLVSSQPRLFRRHMLPTNVHDRQIANAVCPCAFFVLADAIDKSKLNDPPVLRRNGEIQHANLHPAHRSRSIVERHLQTTTRIRLRQQTGELHAPEIAAHRNAARQLNSRRFFCHCEDATRLKSVDTRAASMNSRNLNAAHRAVADTCHKASERQTRDGIWATANWSYAGDLKMQAVHVSPLG